MTPRPVVVFATEDDLDAVVALHAARIGDGFLVRLGPKFLARLYRRIVRSDHAFLLVARDGPDVCGFAAVSLSTRRLYREFLVRDGVLGIADAAPAVISAPRETWETLRYGVGAGSGDLPAAEVLSVAVPDGAANRGVGSTLVAAALVELERLHVRSARVVTAAENVAAQRMYERVGFERVRRTEVHSGVPQELMVWR